MFTLVSIICSHRLTLAEVPFNSSLTVIRRAPHKADKMEVQLTKMTITFATHDSNSYGQNFKLKAVSRFQTPNSRRPSSWNRGSRRTSINPLCGRGHREARFRRQTGFRGGIREKIAVKAKRNASRPGRAKNRFFFNPALRYFFLRLLVFFAISFLSSLRSGLSSSFTYSTFTLVTIM